MAPRRRTLDRIEIQGPVELTLAHAREMISAALDHARGEGLPPIAVVVVDRGGHVIAFEREDRSPNRRFDIAYGKAHGAISMGLNSRTIADLARDRPELVHGLGAVMGGALVPAAGALIVIHEGEAIGALAVSGATSDQDEQAALVGIHAAGFIASAR